MSAALIAEPLRYRYAATRWRIIERAGAVHRRVPGAAVALTFDDGPHAEWTARILDVLRAQRVQATFFCVGENARRHPDLVRRIAAEGHAVGSHSETHRVDAARAPFRALRDFEQGRAAVDRALGRPTELFRPPHGSVNLVSAILCRRRRFSTWLWTVEAADWQSGRNVDDLVAGFTGKVRGGDVLLMHDWVEEPIAPEATDRSALVAALPQIIHRIRESGLALVPLR